MAVMIKSVKEVEIHSLISKHMFYQYLSTYS